MAKQQFKFTLKYRVAPLEGEIRALVGRLIRQGRDDTSWHIEVDGLTLGFRREAESAYLAVRRALMDVRNVAPNWRLVEAGPDMVGLTEVAEVLRMTRQNMRKLMVAHASFPAALHEGRATSIWHLCEVLDWLADRGDRYDVSPALIELSRVLMEVNLSRRIGRLDMLRREELRALVT